MEECLFTCVACRSLFSKHVWISSPHSLSARHKVLIIFINAKRDAKCARFVYVNICKIS